MLTAPWEKRDRGLNVLENCVARSRHAINERSSWASQRFQNKASKQAVHGSMGAKEAEIPSFI